MEQQSAPEIINGYQIIRRIGEGTYGKVKQAMHPNGRDLCAIKIYKQKYQRQQLTKEEEQERLQKLSTELDFLMSADSPYIINFLDFFLHKCCDTNFERLCIVLEYAPLSNLHDYMHSSPLSEEDALRIFTHVSLGLDWMHSRGIAHRDLKPANILMFEGKRAKLGDFGTVRDVGTEDYRTVEVGTKRYRAPEQVAGGYDVKVDVWASGIVLYEMLTGGRHPYKVEYQSFAEYADSIKYIQEPYFPDIITDNCKVLLQQILQVDPSKRLSIKEVLQLPQINSLVVSEIKDNMSISKGAKAPNKDFENDNFAIRKRPQSPPPIEIIIENNQKLHQQDYEFKEMDESIYTESEI
ncbi:hypothetical protein FGO68_gene13807 [Halteria grandinella]|uniref:Protein kinase domain-containing protein n=1 Tax=Halteria grandinella TaxID=5974 RepID=A0A8J8NXC0_HALGN|nr:hypothetical protein FGO68_gene13807 [Halteria grandinella]